VRLLAPARGARLRSGHPVTVRWQASDADSGAPTVTVEYSPDGGRTYHVLAQSEGAGHAVLPAGMLTASRQGRLRLLATDGFNTTATAPRPVVVGARAPTVTITDPASREPVQGGEELYLQGSAVDDVGRSVPSGRLRWYAGRHLLGTGAMLSAALPAGANSVTLEARATDGVGRATVGVRVHVTTPLFLRFVAPHRLSRRARTLTISVAATEPAVLKLGDQHASVGRNARKVNLRIQPGRSTLNLHFVLSAGGRSSAQDAVITRR
jgi:hypothetical protein